MGIFGPKPGTWSVFSEKDKRWNKSGNCEWLVSGGIYPGAKLWIEACEEKFGSQPDDLEYSFWKD